MKQLSIAYLTPVHRPAWSSACQFYEVTFERSSAGKLICRCCGTTVEFPIRALEALRRDIASMHGFDLAPHVDDVHAYQIVGTCEECAQKRGSARIQADQDGRGALLSYHHDASGWTRVELDVGSIHRRELEQPDLVRKQGWDQQIVWSGIDTFRG